MKRLSAKARHEALYEISCSSNILGFCASDIETLFDDDCIYCSGSYAQKNLNSWEVGFAMTIKCNAYELLGNENDADEIRNNVDITNCYNLSLITITSKKAIRLFRKAIVNYIKYEVLGWEREEQTVEETTSEEQTVSEPETETATEVTTAAETAATPATVSATASSSIPDVEEDDQIVIRTRIESTGHGVTLTTEQGDKICYSHPMPDRDKCREGTEQTVTEVASLVVKVTKELFVAAEQELGHYPLAWALTHGWDVTKPLTLPPKFRNAGTQIDHRHYGEVVQNYRMAVDIEDLYALADYYLTYEVWTVCEITDEVRAKTREQVRLLTAGLEEGCVLADRKAINNIREIPLYVLSGMLMCRKTFPDRYADAAAEITAIKLEICERVPVAYDLVADVWNSDLEDSTAISALLAFAKAELDIDAPQSPRADGMDWQNTAEQVLDRAWEDYYNNIACVAHDVMNYVTELRARV